MAHLTCLDLGRAAYLPTLDLQLRLADEVRASGGEAAWLLLVEHEPPAVTLGRRGREADILASRAALAARGVEIHRATRGGEATVHGPGQLVGYPILAFRELGLSLRGYVAALEEALIRTLRRFGAEGQRLDGLTGVWAGGRKVAAIGVAASRWVAYHGFSLNVAADLSAFDWIVPCGSLGGGVTSLSRLLGRGVSVCEVKPAIAECFAEVLGLDAASRAPAPK